MQTLLTSLIGSSFAVVLVLWLFEKERKKNPFSPFNLKNSSFNNFKKHLITISAFLILFGNPMLNTKNV